MASPQSSSKARMSKGTERLVFKFDFSLRDYIQDVVHSGTHGHFTEARLLAHDSLEQFDQIFPIALEIMRLMYDQGDVDALHSYIDRRAQTHGTSWTAKALCIVHLMHDTCEIPCGESAKVAVTTTPRDLFAANLNVRRFEDLDDERIFAVVLILRMVYTGHPNEREPQIVNFRSVPAILQKDSSLYQFVEYLLRQERFWAAANVMTTCFRSYSITCAAIWRSTQWFLQGNTTDEDDHTACFRMILLLVFMEGLLYCGLGEGRTMLGLWNQAKTERDPRLLPLGKRLGAETWLSSRSYVRCQLLDLDKSIHDRNERKDLQPATIDDRQRLQRLYAYAERNDDRYLLEDIRWRTSMLFASNPPTTSTRRKGALNLPINLYLKRRGMVQGALPVVKAGAAGKESERSDHPAHQSGIPVQSGGPSLESKAPMLQSQPPWQYSQNLGGSYVYKRSIDMIVRQDGQQFQRPSWMHPSSLQNAVWEGPLPAPPSVAQLGTSVGQRSSRPQGDHTLRGHASGNSQVQQGRSQQGRNYAGPQSQVPHLRHPRPAAQSDHDDEEVDDDSDSGSAAASDNGNKDEGYEENEEDDDDEDEDDDDGDEDDDDDDDEDSGDDDVAQRGKTLLPLPDRQQGTQLLRRRY